MGRGFEDSEFRSFLLSPLSVAKMPEWDRALTSFKQANLQGIAARALEWLPAGSPINARVFPLVKPHANSFVWGDKERGSSSI